MLRFGLSLVAAALVTVAGYAALGNAATPHLKVIATVVARPHTASSLSVTGTLRGVPVLQ